MFNPEKTHLARHFCIYHFNFTRGLFQMFSGSTERCWSSFLGQHVKLLCFDEDCLRNLITVSAAARGRNMPTEEKFNFHHNSSKLAALILASAMPLAVFFIFAFCEYVRGCRWVVMVVAPCVCVWAWAGGQALRSQRWWWRSGGICQLASSAWSPDWRFASWPCFVAG